MLIMSMLMAAAAPAGDAATSLDRAYWRNVVREANRMEVPAITLHRALNAPESRRQHRATVRYCYPLDQIEPNSDRMVCRSRNEWLSLGLDPIGQES